MRQLSGLDASFVYLEAPRAPMHIGSIAIYDPIDGAGRRRHVQGDPRAHHVADAARAVVPREAAARPARPRPPVLGRRSRLRPRVPRPPHRPAQARRLAPAVHPGRPPARPRALDLDRPLWEFYVIEGLDNVDGVPPGSFALVSKVHHAAIDGVSGAEMTAVIHDTSADARGAPTSSTTTSAGGKCRAPSSSLARAGVNNGAQPFGFARLARPDGALTLAQPRRPAVGRAVGAPDAVQRADHRPPGRRRPRLRPRRHEADQVRRAGRDDQRRRRRHRHRGVAALPARQGRAARRPLLAMAPISVRTDDESGSMGNQVSAMMVVAADRHLRSARAAPGGVTPTPRRRRR